MTVHVPWCWESMNEASFARIYKKWRPTLVSKTVYLVHDHQEACEIVQEGFTLWWSSGKACDSAGGYTWLYRFCHNKAIDHLRSGRVRYMKTSLEGLEGISQLSLPGSIDERVIHAQHLRRLASQLGQRELRVLGYRVVDGLEIKEIAGLMQLSEKTIKRCLAQIRERLRGIEHGGR